MAPYESNQHIDDLGWPWINTTEPSSVSIAEYRRWYIHHSSMVGPNITDCSLEEEMNKVSILFDFLYNRVTKAKVMASKRDRKYVQVKYLKMQRTLTKNEANPRMYLKQQSQQLYKLTKEGLAILKE